MAKCVGCGLLRLSVGMHIIHYNSWEHCFRIDPFSTVHSSRMVSERTREVLKSRTLARVTFAPKVRVWDLQSNPMFPLER